MTVWSRVRRRIASAAVLIVPGLAGFAFVLAIVGITGALAGPSGTPAGADAPLNAAPLVRSQSPSNGTVTITSEAGGRSDPLDDALHAGENNPVVVADLPSTEPATTADSAAPTSADSTKPPKAKKKNKSTPGTDETSTTSTTAPQLRTAPPTTKAPTTTKAPAPPTPTTTKAPTTTATPTTTTKAPTTTTTQPPTTTTTTTTTEPPTTTSAPSTTTAPTQPPVTGPEPFTKRYEAQGGAIVVSWTGTRLRLEAVEPAPGFRSEADVDPHRIRVVFLSAEDDDDDDVVQSRIEVAFVDGEIVVRID